LSLPAARMRGDQLLKFNIERMRFLIIALTDDTGRDKPCPYKIRARLALQIRFTGAGFFGSL
jgi:hypothetical protein